MGRIDCENMVFSAEKMMERIEAAGLVDLMDSECKEIMAKIDGLPIKKNHYKALVHDEIEFYVTHPELGQVSVNYKDCVKKEV